MVEEIFGPVLTVYVYDDSDFDEVLTMCDEASPYANWKYILKFGREYSEGIQCSKIHSR